jgi:4-hydroxybenzoyl-CoA thioesterase
MPLSSRHEVAVEWGDCDPAGIVYYPAYFRWCDQATYRLNSR